MKTKNSLVNSALQAKEFALLTFSAAKMNSTQAGIEVVQKKQNGLNCSTLIFPNRRGHGGNERVQNQFLPSNLNVKDDN